MGLIYYTFAAFDSTVASGSPYVAGLTPVLSSLKTTGGSPGTDVSTHATITAVGGGVYQIAYDPTTFSEAAGIIDLTATIAKNFDRYLPLTLASSPPITGDAFARLGANGAGLTSVPYGGPAALTDYQQRAVAVTLPAAPTDWLTASSVKADAVTKLQAGLSTYAGGPVASVTAQVNLNLAQTGLSPRALDGLADSALTVGDALVCAISAAAGKESRSGTAYVIQTPSTGTTIRTFTLDSATAPTTRS